MPTCIPVNPMMRDPRIPDRLPKELIRARPAAAAEPERSLPGNIQNSGISDKTPEAVNVRKINATQKC